MASATLNDPETDLEHMRAALALARRGLGRVWPNPAVGAVLVRDGRVVGRGWTQPGGRPHAETEALARAGEAAAGATLYVTLEPCSHHGKTPPCVDALLAAGIARAVIAIEDPDPRVSGRGIAGLREAGVETVLGVSADEARDLNAGFLLCLAEGRPLVTLKLAMTLDGRIATRTGESRWITGESARARAHLMRARHDAVVVGSGTVLADDPLLNVRLPGLGDWSPLRIVLDGRMRLPLTSSLVASAGEIPTLLVTLEGGDRLRRRAFVDCGVEVIEAPPGADGALDLKHVLSLLAERGLTRILAEGGARLAAALLRLQLVDRLAIFRAPGMIGGDGLPAAEGFGLEHLAEIEALTPEETIALGPDRLETYRRAG
ncbi:MAG TPA: bifunctional diaminohydroxyphosphoribosylaminopyrimidine deaminase/5-amino-6-(5-phosphoribosylamino)uracil reductase RibD [Candidatus Udaeobacter sp.]|nr:bifunctional diaminohydroxyphosphoribosylaminopyrimidine deaminase/5-amino-6-(5-phosphoribosylamino)uracil reductase RibD [Candidatus Udaeobacter sp.]